MSLPFVAFEVLVAETMEVTVFWVVALCASETAYCCKLSLLLASAGFLLGLIFNLEHGGSTFF
jgi:hypothetical protein